MTKYIVEVAVGFTDNTWKPSMTEVEDFPESEVEKVAEEKVLEDYMNHPTKIVSFVTTIHIISEEE